MCAAWESSPAALRGSRRTPRARCRTWAGIPWIYAVPANSWRVSPMAITRTSCTVTRSISAMPRSRALTMARRSAPACNGAISTARNSTPSARPRSARACSRISWRSIEHAARASPLMRLIPAIDLKDGRCVRLMQVDFARETRYGVEPAALLSKYRDLGADWLHVVDLDAAKDGSLGNRPLITHLAAQQTLHLQVGGGLRNTAAVTQMLDLGVARAVIGSAAVTHV